MERSVGREFCGVDNWEVLNCKLLSVVRAQE